MKQFTAKLFRPALVMMLVLILSLAGSVMPASALVEISDAFYVTDEANVLTDATEDYIIQQNGFLEANCKGAQIAVVVVDFLDGMDIEDYCYQVFDEMNLGADGEDNGVLLLLTIGEENYWCMQGTGLINSLSAGAIDDILWYNLEPDFAVGNYDAGVRTVFDVLYGELCSIYGVSDGSSSGYEDDYYDGSDAIEDVTLTMTDWIIFIVFVLILMAAVLFVFTLIKKALRKSTDAAYNPTTTTYSRPLQPRRRSRPVIYIGPRPRRRPFGRPPYHGGPGMPPPGSRPTSRPSSRPTSSARPTVRPSSSRPSRPSRPTSSFGGGGRISRPSGRGGGGMSRGGGAGRRGR